MHNIGDNAGPYGSANPIDLPATWEELVNRIGNTPVVPVEMRIGDRRWVVHLKLEGYNPFGSIKDRTAYSLIRSIEADHGTSGPLTIVESTSGNLGVALAAMCKLRGHSLIAVVDPKISDDNLEILKHFGARIEMADIADESGGYLTGRLDRVRRICATEAVHWTNQYANQANPVVHFRQTGPEIVKDLGPAVDCVFVAVSTGGTIAGIADYFKSLRPKVITKVIGVDAVGSVAIRGMPGRRNFAGIGASRRSDFVTAEMIDDVILVPDDDTAAICRKVTVEAGLCLGASSGAVVAASVRYLDRNPGMRRAVCVCPDRGVRYSGSVYNDAWLRDHEVDLEGALDRYEAIGLRFSRLSRMDP